MRRSSRALILLTAVAALAAAGCGENGGDGDTDGAAAAQAAATPEVTPVGDEVTGSVVQYADCDDWNAGSEPARRATVEKLRGQLTPTQSKDARSPLSDERAYEILEKACSPDYAGSLRLYKLYARAQGYAPLAVD